MILLAKRTIEVTRRVGSTWEWALLDWFSNDIARGKGCRTREEARRHVREERVKYQARIAEIIAARKSGRLKKLPYAGVPGNLWCNRTKSKAA